MSPSIFFILSPSIFFIFFGPLDILGGPVDIGLVAEVVGDVDVGSYEVVDG